MRTFARHKLSKAEGERILWHALEYLQNQTGAFGEKDSETFKAVLLIRRLLERNI